jgi:AraC-like DNA-binding protein
LATKPQEGKYFIYENLDMPLIRGGGLVLTRAPFVQRQHRHREFEFLYMVSGEVGLTLVDGRTLRLTGGEFYVVQPDTPHGWIDDIVYPSSYFWIGISPSMPDAPRHLPMTQDDLARLAQNLEKAGNCAMIGDPRMNELFRDTRRVLVESDDRDSPATLAWLRSIVGRWVLVLHESLQWGAHVKESPEIGAAKSFMAREFADVVTLHQLADQAQMSEGWFSERFVREVGLTPIDYLNRLRCSEARDLLDHSSTAIGEIAFQVGFSSTQYFSTAFKKYTGMTPSGYRKRSHGIDWDDVALFSVDP